MAMIYLYAQDTSKRIKWELDVALHNLYSLDPKASVVLLFLVESEDDPVVAYLERRYPKANIHCYLDTRGLKSYVAAIRPFLWYCYLKEDKSREKHTYFQIESDVIFREIPDYSKIELSPSRWAGSNCDVYMNADYIKSKQNGEQILDGFARLMKIDREVLEGLDGSGAQWILVEPKADYWLKVMSDCYKLKDHLDITESDIQKWTAEMWAQLFNAPLFGAQYYNTPELNFCWPSEPSERWHKTKILHNSGVIEPEQKSVALDKNAYTDREPFDDDLSWVKPDYCSWHYVQAIKGAR